MKKQRPSRCLGIDFKMQPKVTGMTISSNNQGSTTES
jgi:hypothetical protein